MKLILFDIDGTLITTGGAGLRALDRAFLSLQRIPRASAGCSVAGRTDPAIFKDIFQKHLHRSPTSKEMNDLVEFYLTGLAAELDGADGYRSMEGLDVLLSLLAGRQDVFLALGTGNLEKGGRLKLEKSGFNRFFSVGGFGSDHEDRTQVLRTGVLRAEKASGRRFPGKKVFVVGDTIHDVSAGKAIGAVTVAVGTGHASENELLSSSPDHFLSSFEDTEAFLRLLGQS